MSYALAYAGDRRHGGNPQHEAARPFPGTDAPLSHLPLVGTPLPRFEVPALRQCYQRAAHDYCYLKDEYL